MAAAASAAGSPECPPSPTATTTNAGVPAGVLSTTYFAALAISCGVAVLCVDPLSVVLGMPLTEVQVTELPFCAPWYPRIAKSGSRPVTTALPAADVSK